MVLNLVERQRDCKSIEGQDIRELEQEVGDALQSGEESCPGARVHRKRDENHSRRTRCRLTENLLVGHIQEKVMIVEKVSTKDWDRDWSQLESPIETKHT